MLITTCISTTKFLSINNQLNNQLLAYFLIDYTYCALTTMLKHNFSHDFFVYRAMSGQSVVWLMFELERKPF